MLESDVDNNQEKEGVRMVGETIRDRSLKWMVEIGYVVHGWNIGKL